MDIEDKRYKINPYTVPDDYFGSLDGRIRVHIEKHGHDKPGTWERFFKPALGMAAAFALVLAIGAGIMRITGTAGNMPDDSGAIPMEEYDLMRTVVSIAYSSGIDGTVENEDPDGGKLTDDEVIEYLSGEDRVLLYLAATYDENEE